MNLQQQPALPLRTTASGRDKFLQNYVDNKGRGNSSIFSKDRKDRLAKIRDTAEFDPISGGYNLNPFQKHVLGITDQDIFNAKRSAEVEAYNQVYGGDYKTLGLGDRIPGGQDLAVTRSKIADALEYKDQAPKLKQQLAQVGGGHGIAALQKLGKNPSLLEMQGALTTAQRQWEENPANETSGLQIVRNAKEQQLEATKAQTLEATRANELANKSLGIQESSASFQAQLAAENARNRWEDKRQNRVENALTRQMNAENNAMQMQLEYSRLAQADQNRADDRREQIILMLVQGLSNLGMGLTV